MEHNFAQFVDAEGLKKITKGTLIAFVGFIALKIIAYVYLVIRAKILGPFWLGIYVLGVTVITAISVVSRMGFHTALIRLVSVYKSTNDSSKLKGILKFSFSISFITSIFFSIILFFLSRYLSISILHNLDLIKPLQLFSLSIPFMTAFSLIVSTFRGLKDMKNKVLIDFLQPASAFLFFLVLFNFFKLKIWAAVYAYIISYFISILIGYLKLTKKLPFLIEQTLKPFINKKEVILYSLPLLFISTIGILFQRVDILMIGYFRSSQEVGLYAPAAHFALIVSFPLLLFNQMFAPSIADYYHKDKLKELTYLFKTITRWVFIISFPLFLFLLLFNKEIMLLLGNPYMGAWPILIILAFAYLINASVGSVAIILAMTVHQHILLLTVLLATLLNISLNIFLIPRLGILGASLSTGISIILLNLFNLFFVFKIIKMHPFSIKFYKPFFSGSISLILTYLISHMFYFLNHILKLSLMGLLFFAFYLFFGFLLKYEKEEIFILHTLKSEFLQFWSFSHRK